MFSPGGVPRVLDNVIVSGVSNQQDGVVQLRGFGAVAENSARVIEPGGGIDANGNGLVVVGGDQSAFASGLDHGVLRGLEGSRLDLAVSFDSLIGIFAFGGDTLGLNVRGSPFGPGSGASLALESFLAAAIDQLLFREALESASLEGRGSFQNTGSAERPAGSALSLVLDGGDGVLGSPVNARSDFSVGGVVGSLFGGGGEASH